MAVLAGVDCDVSSFFVYSIQLGGTTNRGTLAPAGIGALWAHTVARGDAVLRRGLGQTDRARSRSSMRSSTPSIPIDNLMSPGVIPSRVLSSSLKSWWVVVAG
jgi:hypothetical protein